MNWAQEQRQKFIAERLKDPGFIIRKDLCEAFRISLPQATDDFNAFKEAYPKAMVYVPRHKRYEKRTSRHV